MSKYLKFILFISLTLVLCGCGNDKEDELNDLSSNTEYYIKYEATVTSIYIGNTIKYTVSTETGLQTFKSGKSFSQVFGPFKKGFNASITVDASDWYQADCEVRIYVCKGSQPFALKANNAGGKSVSASYLIDY